MQLNKLYEPADADTDGFGDGVTGATFTLIANDAGDGMGHIVTILNNTSTDHSGKTVTLVGTDVNGQPISEAVTGPDNAATVESTLYFLTLESATPSATIGSDTFDIGWSAKSVTRPIAMNWRGGVAGMQITVTGTIDYDFEQTNSDLQNSTAAAVWFIDDTAHDGATGNLVVRFDANPRFSRFKVNSLSDATIAVALVQSDV